MAKAGFYNDNEYRAYPFVANADIAPSDLKTALYRAVVDAGFVLGVEGGKGSAQSALFGFRVWLHSVSRTGGTLTFSFKTTSTSPELVFTTETSSDEWHVLHAESISGVDTETPCAVDPLWSGYIVIGSTAELLAEIAAETTVSFEYGDYEIEPARIQNLGGTYLNSISVGNFDRVRIPPCGSAGGTATIRAVVPAELCLRGPIKFKEGYNCQITQVARENSLTFSAGSNFGAAKDAAYCENGGEIPLYADEMKPEGSVFYSGGPACKDLIFTINGVGGSSVSFIAGNGITINTTDDKISITQKPNLRTNCASAAPTTPSDPGTVTP
jgi:hypothetical protein